MCFLVPYFCYRRQAFAHRYRSLGEHRNPHHMRSGVVIYGHCPGIHLYILSPTHRVLRTNKVVPCLGFEHSRSNQRT